MQVDVEPEPSSEQDMVSDRQTNRLQLPGLEGDFRSLWKSSTIDGILDTVLPADVPLCIAPKPGLYDLTLYEVCSPSLLTFPTLTRTRPAASLPTFLRLHIIVASPKPMHNREDAQG